MSITIDDNLLGTWYVQVSSRCDFMGGLSKVSDQEFRFTYRLRFYVDDKTFDSDDKKNWYEVVIPGDQTRAVFLVSEVTRNLAEKSGGERYELLRGSMTLEQFVDEFMKLPFVHAQIPDSEDQAWTPPTIGLSAESTGYTSGN